MGYPCAFKDMGDEGRSGGFPVGPGHGDSEVVRSDHSEHFGTLQHFDLFLKDMPEFFMFRGDGRSVNNKFSGFWYEISVFVEMDLHAFAFQLSGEGGRGFVIP